MQFTMEKQVNIARAAFEPKLGLEGAALLLLIYELEDKGQMPGMTPAQVTYVYNSRRLQLFEAALGIATKLGAAAA